MADLGDHPAVPAWLLAGRALQGVRGPITGPFNRLGRVPERAPTLQASLGILPPTGWSTSPARTGGSPRRPVVACRRSGEQGMRVVRSLVVAVLVESPAAFRRNAPHCIHNASCGGRECGGSSRDCGRNGRRRVLPERTGRAPGRPRRDVRAAATGGCLLGPDVGDGAVSLVGMRPPVSDFCAPAPELGVNVVEVAEGRAAK